MKGHRYTTECCWPSESWRFYLDDRKTESEATNIAMRIISRKTHPIRVSLFLLAVSATGSNAAVLLNIDPTNIGAVRFDATSAAAGINDTTSIFEDGITLLGVLASDVRLNIDFNGTLAAPGGEFYEDASTGVGTSTFRDLNLYTNNRSAAQFFSRSAPALTGSALIDFTGASIPVGLEGNIIVGDTYHGSGDVIGQWRTIPEPSSVLLLGIGWLFLIYQRCKR